MMYGHLSEAMEQHPSLSTPIPGRSSVEPPPHIYIHADIRSVLTEDVVSKLVSSLPQWCSAIKDRLLFRMYISPLYFSRCRNPSELKFDFSKILIVGNCTSEEEMKSISQES